MMRNSTLNIFLIITLFISCKALKNVSSITYEYHNQGMGVSSKLILENNDMTFNYNHHAGLVSQASIGKWKQDGEKLILISDPSYRNGFIEVVQNKEFSMPGKIKIDVIDKKSNSPISFAIVSIDDDKAASLNTNDLGEVIFDRRAFSFLEIGYLGGPYKWFFSEAIKGDIKVYLIEEDLTKAYFENEVWKRSGKKIISPSGLVYKSN